MEFATPEEQGQRSVIIFESWEIEYAVWTTDDLPVGEVPVVVAFHGFARPLEDLRAAHHAWPHPHAMVSIHLPHHGGSGPLSGSGPDDRPMDPEVFNRIIDAIISREIPNAGNRTLLGYSIGGRIALALMVNRPAAWNDVVLLAPDGLKQSPFYAITVHPLGPMGVVLDGPARAMGVEVVGCTAQVGTHLKAPARVHLLPFFVTRHAHDGLERLERPPSMLAEAQRHQSGP